VLPLGLPNSTGLKINFPSVNADLGNCQYCGFCVMGNKGKFNC